MRAKLLSVWVRFFDTLLLSKSEHLDFMRRLHIFGMGLVYRCGAFPGKALNIKKIDCQRMRVYQVSGATSDLKDSSSSIVYLHGGGFVLGGLDSYRPLMRALSAKVTDDIFFIEYSRAPENKLDDILDQVSMAIQELIEAQGLSGSHLMADAAGAYLAVKCLENTWLSQAFSSVVLCSPWLDTARVYSQNSGEKNSLHRQVEFYQKTLKVSGSRLGNALEGELSGFPPTLILSSGNELFMEQSLELKAALEENGCSVKLQVWSNMVHAWPVYVDGSREFNSTLRIISSFMKESQGDVLEVPVSQVAS